MTELEKALRHIKTRADAWAVREVEQALSQEPCTDVVSRRKAISVISACDGKSAQIEALEKLPSVTPKPCDDVISREAAIKVTCNDCKYDCRYKESKEYCDCCGYIDRLRTLPSVTPKPCDDAVSRQAVLDGIEELKKSPWATDKRGNGFEYLITEALDVVADLCVKQLPPITPHQKSSECNDAKNREMVKEQECEKVGQEPILIIREAIEDYVCNYLTDTAKAQKVLNALQDMEQEPCDDTVSRDAVIECIDEAWMCSKDTKEIADVLEKMVNALPPVTQKSNLELICEELAAENDKLIEQLKQKQKSGKWITTRTFMHDGEYYCDRCKCEAPNNEKWNYCPNCGAKMIEKE